jgi:hypothetical protein
MANNLHDVFNNLGVSTEDRKMILRWRHLKTLKEQELAHLHPDTLKKIEESLDGIKPPWPQVLSAYHIKVLPPAWDKLPLKHSSYTLFHHDPESYTLGRMGTGHRAVLQRSGIGRCLADRVHLHQVRLEHGTCHRVPPHARHHGFRGVHRVGPRLSHLRQRAALSAHLARFQGPQVAGGSDEDVCSDEREARGGDGPLRLGLLPVLRAERHTLGLRGSALLLQPRLVLAGGASRLNPLHGLRLWADGGRRLLGYPPF